MTSGASREATDVASRVKYEAKSTELVVTLILGFAASNALTASSVILVRAVLPHHENAMVTGCAAVPRSEPADVAFPPPHAASASRQMPTSPTPRARLVPRPHSRQFMPRVDRIAFLSRRAVATLESGIGQRVTEGVNRFRAAYPGSATLSTVRRISLYTGVIFTSV